MKNDNYKYFKEGDYIVCIKNGKCLHPNLFNNMNEPGFELKLYRPYIFDRYLVTESGSMIYDALILKNYLPLYDGKDFMFLSEFRRLKLNRLKRKLFRQNILRKFGFVK